LQSPLAFFDLVDAVDDFVVARDKSESWEKDDLDVSARLMEYLEIMLTALMIFANVG
jgi:hypothetical protein